MGTEAEVKERPAGGGELTAPPSAAISVEETVRRSERVLARSGVESPRRNAEYLVAFSLGCERWQLYLDRRRRLSPDEAENCRRLTDLRAGGVPLAYLLGTVGFHNLELKVDRRALIPRPETELLVNLAIKWLKTLDGFRPCVLDLGCGSGNIALALAREFPNCDISASDISPPALSLARENAEELGLASGIDFRLGDLFEPWADRLPAGFDLIVSNPPYLTRSELEGAPREVRDHEPRLSLDGGEDGLAVIRRLIGESPGYLKPGGRLLLEIGSGQARKVLKLLESDGHFTEVEVSQDLADRDRAIVARKAGPGTIGDSNKTKIFPQEKF